MMEYKDYYKILDLDRGAKEKAIKTAYRKLARKHHPDVNHGDKAAEERFREINEAYEVLSDPEKRQKYDQFGAQWRQYEQGGGSTDDFNWNQWQAQSEPGYSHSYRTVTPEEYETVFGSGGGYSDFFDTLFGGAGHRGAESGAGYQGFSAQPRPRSGRDQEHPLQVTLENAFRGTNRVLEWEDGRKIEAKIPPGVKTGSRVRLKGQGTPGINGGEPGDLYLLIEVMPDTRFQRDGDDLKTTIPVDLFQLLLGGKMVVAGIDRSVKLDIPPETQNGKIFRLRGLGMPKLRQPEQRGDLYVTLDAILPQHLSEQEQTLIQQWQTMRR
jgi:curved DNA-binding protein